MKQTTAVVMVFLLAAGCAGSAGSSTTLETTISEYQFAPSTWTVPAGQEISIDLTNAGTMSHQWVLLDPGVRIESEAELSDDIVYVEDDVDAGASTTLTFTAPEPGTYQVICGIPSHFAAGMEGTLTVTDG